MAVVIRLSRPGKPTKKKTFFRITVMDSKRGRDSKFIEGVGYYDPTKNPEVIHFKKDRVEYWLSQGAKLTPTVKSLFKKYTKNKN
jgi:small subunit ribosomal protein S16